MSDELNIQDILDDCKDIIVTPAEFGEIKDKLVESYKGKCLFCNNTGRTLEDPYHCKHCGRDYHQTNIAKNKEYFLANGLTEYTYNIASNWSPEYISKVYNENGRGNLYTQVLRDLVERLSLELKYMVNSQYNNQIIFTTDKNNYEVLLVNWIYKAIKEVLAHDLKCNTELFNMEFVLTQNIYNTELLDYDVLFIELTSHLLNDCLSYLDTLCTIRRRAGKQTYCITRVSPSLILNNNDMSVSSLGVHSSLNTIKSDFSIITMISTTQQVFN